jgi:hypothetical protein
VMEILEGDEVSKVCRNRIAHFIPKYISDPPLSTAGTLQNHPIQNPYSRDLPPHAG